MEQPTRSELERLVLGSLFCTLGRGINETMLLPDDFTGIHQEVFRAISKLSSSGVEADAVAILSEMGGAGSGVATTIASLNNAVVSGANLKYYSDQLKESVFSFKSKELSDSAAERIKSGESPDSVLLDLSSKTNALRDRYKESSSDNSLAETCNDLLRAAEERKPIDGIVKTGLKAIDDMCGGIIPGDYVVLAARPSTGKTALALNIAANHASSGGKVCFVSLEMKKKKIGSRLLSMVSRVSTRMLLRNPAEITEAEAEAMIESAHMLFPIAEKIAVFDDTGPDIGPITQAVKASVRSGSSLIIVDYLQLMECKGENRNQQVSAISRWFKMMVTSLNVPGIALCQLSRDSEKEKRPPKMSDLRDSGSLEQDADVIWFLHRNENEQIVKIIQAKGRDVGVGIRELVFKRDTQTFHDVEKNR